MKKILVTAVLGFAVVAAGQVAQPDSNPKGNQRRKARAAHLALHRRKRRH